MHRVDTSMAPTPALQAQKLAVAGLRNLITKDVHVFAALRSRARSARSLTIGRSPTCDIALDDPCVSMAHCIIEQRNDDSYMLRDNGSMNGTFIVTAGMAHRVDAARLTVGTWILLGNTTLAAVNEQGRTLLSATTETEFRREAYRVYGSLRAAGGAVKKSSETIRRALQWRSG